MEVLSQWCEMIVWWGGIWRGRCKKSDHSGDVTDMIHAKRPREIPRALNDLFFYCFGDFFFGRFRYEGEGLQDMPRMIGTGVCDRSYHVSRSTVQYA